MAPRSQCGCRRARQKTRRETARPNLSAASQRVRALVNLGYPVAGVRDLGRCKSTFSGLVYMRIKIAVVQGGCGSRSQPVLLRSVPNLGLKRCPLAIATMTLQGPSHLRSGPIRALTMHRFSQCRGALCAPVWEAVPHSIRSLHWPSVNGTASRDQGRS
jgi:hypothetical protein